MTALPTSIVWERVTRRPDATLADVIDDCDQDDLDLLRFPAQPCPVCGSHGACSIDSQGRALIHADAVEDA